MDGGPAPRLPAWQAPGAWSPRSGLDRIGDYDVSDRGKTMAVTARFTIEMSPGESLVATSGRFDFTKTWSGGMEGISRGVLLSGGDPATGHAGYVAIEQFEGTLDGRYGTILLNQLGSMVGDEPQLSFVLTPGSGTGQLSGLTGTVSIDAVGDDGVHQVTLTLD